MKREKRKSGKKRVGGKGEKNDHKRMREKEDRGRKQGRRN
jgi:hypothetical protein